MTYGAGRNNKVRKMNLLHTLFDLAGAVARAHRRNRARRELMAMDNRLLADIGIRRGEIDAVVEHLMRGPVHAAQPSAGPTATANENRPEVAA